MPHGKKRATKDTLKILKSDGKAILKKPARKRTQDCGQSQPKQPTARFEDVGLPLLSALATVGSPSGSRTGPATLCHAAPNIVGAVSSLASPTCICRPTRVDLRALF